MLPNIDIAGFQCALTFSANPWDKQHFYRILCNQFRKNEASTAMKKKNFHVT